MRATRRILSVTALVAAGAAALAPARSGLGASLHAAWRAFRDPSLVEHRPGAVEPAPASGGAVDERHVGWLDERALDKELAARVAESGTVGRAALGDLDDPDGAALKSLTLPDLRVPITRRTMRFVRHLTRTEAGRAAFLQRYRRASSYRESIAFALREAGLPEDLLWVAGVESGFDPRAVSSAGAAGLWQLMPATAQLYGLDQSPFVDERRSIARATQAAVTHLRDLYERFHRWDLALAAYNAGYDRISAAIERVSAERGIAPAGIDFGDLAGAHAIAEETIQYVPQIMAFALVASNRSRFGLDAPELGAALDLGEIAVPEGTRLRTIARAAGVSVAVLRDYNPQLLRDRVPPIGGDYLVTLPESRVQRALATFPSYADQEVVARDDDEPSSAEVAVASAFPAGDADAEEPLPRRPVPLGKNRLPELPHLPARELTAPMGAWPVGFAVIDAKLPPSLATPDIGWVRASFSRAGLAMADASGRAADPLGVLSSGGGGGGYRMQTLEGAPTRDAAIEGQLGFLRASPEALASFVLPNGIGVRVRRDAGARTASITVRVATVEEPSAGSVNRGAEAGAAELLSTITVDKADADAAIQLAAARLRLSVADTASSQAAEIRFRAGAPRRKHLQETPYGASWVALGDALFPPDHPLAGTVPGASDDETAVAEVAIADAMRREHARARASLTIVGDVDEAHAKKLAEGLLSPLGGHVESLVSPHAREDHVTVEEDVSAPRALVGWIGPGEGEVGDASLRVAFEVLDGLKTTELRSALVDDAKVAASAHARLEVLARASIAAVEVAPAQGKDAAAAVRALDTLIARLANEGPSGNDVAVAKWILHARLAKQKAALAHRASAKPGAEVHSTGALELNHALRPWALDRTLGALDEVTPATVRAVVRRVLAADHRVVVTTTPRTR